MSRVIVFDFDGVIADSLKECFVVSYCAFHGYDAIVPNNISEYDPRVEAMFNDFRYLVRPAYEYNFLMQAIYDAVEKKGINVEERFYALLDQKSNAAQDFADHFYRLRTRFQDEFPRQWLAMNPAYDCILGVLISLRQKHPLYIASTKDEASIEKILQHYGVEFGRENIFGKNFNIDKQEQFREIASVQRVGSSNIRFIDDNLDHLISVSKLGVQCYLSSWGYNTEKTRRQATSLGFRAVSIEELDGVLCESN